MNREILMSLRKLYVPGSRVILDSMDDIAAPPAGTLGRVSHVDDLGTIFVDWDNGSRLGVVYGIDDCHLFVEEKVEA